MGAGRGSQQWLFLRLYNTDVGISVGRRGHGQVVISGEAGSCWADSPNVSRRVEIQRTKSIQFPLSLRILGIAATERQLDAPRRLGATVLLGVNLLALALALAALLGEHLADGDANGAARGGRRVYAGHLVIAIGPCALSGFLSKKGPYLVALGPGVCGLEGGQLPLSFLGLGSGHGLFLWISFVLSLTSCRFCFFVFVFFWWSDYRSAWEDEVERSWLCICAASNGWKDVQ